MKCFAVFSLLIFFTQGRVYNSVDYASGFDYPYDIVVSPFSYFFVTDLLANSIYSTDGKSTTWLVGNPGREPLDGEFTKAIFERPTQMSFYNHYLFVLDRCTLRSVDLTLQYVTTVLGKIGDQRVFLNVNALNARLNLPQSVAVMAAHQAVFIVDENSSQSVVARYSLVTSAVTSQYTGYTTLKSASIYKSMIYYAGPYGSSVTIYQQRAVDFAPVVVMSTKKLKNVMFLKMRLGTDEAFVSNGEIILCVDLRQRAEYLLEVTGAPIETPQSFAFNDSKIAITQLNPKNVILVDTLTQNVHQIDQFTPTHTKSRTFDELFSSQTRTPNVVSQRHSIEKLSKSLSKTKHSVTLHSQSEFTVSLERQPESNTKSEMSVSEMSPDLSFSSSSTYSGSQSNFDSSRTETMQARSIEFATKTNSPSKSLSISRERSPMWKSRTWVRGYTKTNTTTITEVGTVSATISKSTSVQPNCLPIIFQPSTSTSSMLSKTSIDIIHGCGSFLPNMSLLSSKMSHTFHCASERCILRFPAMMSQEVESYNVSSNGTILTTKFVETAASALSMLVVSEIWEFVVTPEMNAISWGPESRGTFHVTPDEDVLVMVDQAASSARFATTLAVIASTITSPMDAAGPQQATVLLSRVRCGSRADNAVNDQPGGFDPLSPVPFFPFIDNRNVRGIFCNAAVILVSYVCMVLVGVLYKEGIYLIGHPHIILMVIGIVHMGSIYYSLRLVQDEGVKFSPRIFGACSSVLFGIVIPGYLYYFSKHEVKARFRFYKKRTCVMRWFCPDGAWGPNNLYSTVLTYNVNIRPWRVSWVVFPFVAGTVLSVIVSIDVKERISCQIQYSILSVTCFGCSVVYFWGQPQRWWLLNMSTAVSYVFQAVLMIFNAVALSESPPNWLRSVHLRFLVFMSVSFLARDLVLAGVAYAEFKYWRPLIWPMTAENEKDEDEDDDDSTDEDIPTMKLRSLEEVLPKNDSLILYPHDVYDEEMIQIRLKN